MKYNLSNFINYHNNTFTPKSKYNNDNWVAFDIEWDATSSKNNMTFLNDYANTNLDKIASGASEPPVLKEYYSNIVTFGFEDSCGIKGCFDISSFGSQKSFLMAIKEKLLEHQYCFAWGSKAIIRKESGPRKLEGINGDLAVLDSNFRNNGVTSIIKYNRFTSIPFIKNDHYQKNNPVFISDIDLLQVFAKPLVKNIIFKNKYKSLRLDDVGRALLGYGKLDNKTGAKLDEMSIDERKSYCLHDAHIVADLVRIKDGELLKVMDIIASHTGLKFEEVCHKGMASIWKKILDKDISKKIDTVGYGNIPFTIRQLYSNKTPYLEYWDVDYDEEEDEELLEYRENSYEQYVELLEQKVKERSYDTGEDHNPSSNTQLYRKEKGDNLTKHDVIRKYKGGTVLSPQRGIHYDVYVFDVTSLYPTMIISYNISPETVNCSCCRNDFKARAMFDKHILKDCQYVPKKDDNGYWICQRKKGLFSKILQELTEKRVRYKNEGKDIESIAIKSIINSGYGVFGHPNFKYYDPKVAEIVTALGRKTISEMQKIVNEIGFTVLYGDTDSLFVNNIKSKEEVSKFIDECKRKLNIDVSHEKTFRKLILVAKKHYIGILNDSTKEPIIRGMEGIKSDRPEFIQTVFKEMIEDIKNNIAPIPKLKHAFYELDTRQVPKERLAISLVLNKNPHEYANDCLQKRLGTKKNLEKGDLLVYYKCDKQEVVISNPLEKERIRNVSESDNTADISYVKYKEMLLNSVKDIVEILGYNIEHDLLSKKKLAAHYYLPTVTNT